LTLVGWIRRIPRRWHPPTACTHNLAFTHTLYTPRWCRPHRPAPMVSALWARRRFMSSCVASDSSPMSRPPGMTRNGAITTPGKHHLLTAAPVPAAVSRPPGPGTDRAANQHHRTYPADQPAGNGSPTAVAGTASSPALDSPRATSTGARHEQPPAPPAASHHPAAQGAAAGARGTHRAEGRGPRQLHHADPRPAAPAKAQFPWFEVSHGASHSSHRQR
jgi:hypothetical protein